MPTPLQTIFQEHLEVFKVLFESMGQVQPQWIFQNSEGKVEIALTPFGNDDKNSYLQTVQKLLKERGIVRYLMAAEAWMAPGKTEEEARLTPASQHPERQECLILMGEDLNGETVSALAKIIRDPADPKHPRLGEWDIVSGMYEGRFANLFPRNKGALH